MVRGEVLVKVPHYRLGVTLTPHLVPHYSQGVDRVRMRLDGLNERSRVQAEDTDLASLAATPDVTTVLNHAFDSCAVAEPLKA